MTTTLTNLTGHEPHLSSRYSDQGKWRLSPRKLAAMFNLLPPQAVSLPVIAAALQHKDYFVRYNAAQALSRRGDRNARLVVREVLAEGEVRSRASVARFLSGFSWFAGEPLFKQALGDPEARVREATIYALCELREFEAFQLMTGVLADETDEVRAAAAWGLRDCQDPASIPVLDQVLQAEDPEVRMKALEVLGANGLPEAVPLVRKALYDPDAEVIYAATLSLLELKEAAALAELAGIIYQADSLARQPLLRGFFHATSYLHIDIAGNEAADPVLDALAVALQDDHPETRMAATWPLAWIRHSRAETLLKEAYYQEQDERVKGHFVYIAVNLLSPVGRELIEDALHHQKGHVHAVAVSVLDNIDLNQTTTPL